MVLTPPHPSRPLRVLVVDSFPEANSSCWPTIERTGRCQYPGWCLEILHNLVVSHNISVEYTFGEKGEQSDWGTLQSDNITFSGHLGKVHRKEVDMVCSLFVKNPIRVDHFDFSTAVHEVNAAFVAREYPTNIFMLMLNVLKPFENYVWFFLMAAVASQFVIWPLICKVEKSVGLRKETDRWGDAIWGVINAFLNSGDSRFSFYSGALLRLVFSVFIKGLPCSLYTGFILAALLSPQNNSPLKDVQDACRLLASQKYRLITIESKWFNQDMMTSSDAVFAKLREATRHNPIVPYVSDAEALKLVEQGNHIWQASAPLVMVNRKPLFSIHCFIVRESRWLKRMTLRCAAPSLPDVALIQGLPRRSVHFLLAKGSEWRPVFDQAIIDNYPMIDSLSKKYIEDQHADEEKNCTSTIITMPKNIEPLNFWSIAGVLDWFVVGMLLWGVSLLAEIVLHKCPRWVRPDEQNQGNGDQPEIRIV